MAGAKIHTPAFPSQMPLPNNYPTSLLIILASPALGPPESVSKIVSGHQLAPRDDNCIKSLAFTQEASVSLKE